MTHWAGLGWAPVSDFLRSYLTVGIFGLIAVALVSALLGISAVLRPTRPQAQKYINYESGVDPVGSGWGQSNIRYYIFALLFVMFDVEAVFIFPWATPTLSSGRIERSQFLRVLIVSTRLCTKKT